MKEPQEHVSLPQFRHYKAIVVKAATTYSTFPPPPLPAAIYQRYVNVSAFLL